MIKKGSPSREGIIVPLDRRFVVYPGVDKAAGVDEGEEECPGAVCPGSCDVLRSFLATLLKDNSMTSE